MDECFAGGHLRFVNGEWRDDNGDVIEIAHVRHGKWLVDSRTGMSFCSECLDYAVEADTNFCPNCGAKMDLE